jgi:hypothetical protein
MTDKQIRLILAVLVLALYVVGFWLLAPTIGSKGCLGLFLLLWAERTDTALRRSRA